VVVLTVAVPSFVVVVPIVSPTSTAVVAPDSLVTPGTAVMTVILTEVLPEFTVESVDVVVVVAEVEFELLRLIAPAIPPNPPFPAIVII
jgi:hypothetical protein